MAKVPYNQLIFGPLDPGASNRSNRPVGGPIGRPGQLASGEIGTTGITAPGTSVPGTGPYAVPGTRARSGVSPNTGGVQGRVDPNRTTRAPGYNVYAGTGPFQGAAVPGTGFATKEDRDAQKVDPYGSESGNTYVEDRYLNRLYGEDPAFNYAAQRGMDALGTRSAAAGNFNSGAARQQESDYMANLTAQSQAQLDALAAGASGSRQAKINSMFGTGIGLAGGQSGLASAYDLGAAGNMDAANRALLQLNLNKTGVDAAGNQGAMNFITSLWGGGGRKAGQ